MYLDFFKKCLEEKIFRFFEEDIISKSENEGNSNVDSLADILQNQIQTHIQDIFELLCLSLLSGEYISAHDFEDKINKTLNELYLKIESYDFEQIDGSEYEESINFLSKFLDTVKISLKKYLKLQQLLTLKLENPDARILVDIARREDSVSNNELKLYDDIKLFLHALSLAEIDHDENADLNGKLTELIHLKLEISALKKVNPTCRDLVVEKCNLLIYKFKKTISSEDVRVYILDGKLCKIDDEDTSVQYLKNLEGKINFYNSISNRDLSLKYKDISRKFSQNRSFEDYFSLIKIHKDENKCPDRAQQVFLDFKKRQEGILYDKRAYQISLNYLYNSYISTLLKNKNLPISKIDSIGKELNDLQIETGVKNFFPYCKLSEWFCDKLDTIIEKSYSEESELDKNEVEDVLSRFEESIEKMEKNLKWSKAHLLYSFLLPYKECCYKVTYESKNDYIPAKEIEIFVASSFLLPIDYIKRNTQVKELRNVLEKYKILVSAQQKTRLVIQKTREAYKDAQELQKSNVITSITTLSIFTALITFIVGGVQMFTYVKTLRGGLLIMLALSYIVCLLVSMIWLMTKSRKNTEKHSAAEMIILGLYALSTLAIFYFLHTDAAREILINITPK